MENLETDQLLFLVAAVAVAAFWVGRASARSGGGVDREEKRFRQQQDAEHAYAALSAEAQNSLDRLLTDGKIIQAVKLVRDETGMGLRDAKLLVDYRVRLLKGA